MANRLFVISFLLFWILKKIFLSQNVNEAEMRLWGRIPTCLIKPSSPELLFFYLTRRISYLPSYFKRLCLDKIVLKDKVCAR